MSDPRIPSSIIAKDVYGGMHEITTAQLRWRPSVYGIIVKNESVLVIPQRDGRVDLPGGGVEFGERLEDALHREVYEETGLEVGNPRLIRAESSFFKMPDKPDDFIQSVMMYYALDVVGGELSVVGFDEFERLHLEKARWLPLEELAVADLTSSVDWRPFVLAVAGK